MIFLDQFFFFYSKLFSCFYLQTIDFNPLLKKNILHYLLIDIIHQWIGAKLYFIRYLEISFFEFLILGFGDLLMYYQFYHLVSFLNLLIKKRTHKNYFLFFFIFSISLTKFCIKLFSIFYKHNKNSNIYTLNQSKLLFISMFLIFFVFIFIYIVPAFLDFYWYVSNYTADTHYKKFIIILFIIVFLKMLFELFQVGFLDVGRFLMNKNATYQAIMRSDSDNLFICLCWFSTLFHCYLIYFLKSVDKILMIKCNFTDIHTYHPIPVSIKIKKYTISQVLLHNVEIYHFLLQEISNNIGDKYTIPKSKIKFIFNNQQGQYQELFDQKTKFYECIMNNKAVYYDAFIDLKDSYHIYDIPKYLYEKHNVEAIVNLLEKLSIRIVLPIINNNQLEGCLIIENSSHEMTTKKFYNEDIEYLLSLIHYIKSIKLKFTNFYLYSKFLYVKRIAEYSYIENDQQYKNIYKDINKDISHFYEGFICEDKKKTLRSFFSYNFENTDYFKSIHKNKELNTDLSDIFQKDIFFKDNKYMTVLSNNKVNFGKYTLSFYIILPFAKITNNKLEYIINKNKINNIFPLYSDYFNSSISFFIQLQSNFYIKIIVYDKHQSFIFKKIVNYVCSDFIIKYISLANIENNFSDILKTFNEIYNLNKKVYIWLHDIKKNTFYFQNLILYYFVDKFIQSEQSNVKLFIITNNGHYSHISDEFIAISKKIEKKDMLIKDILIHDLAIILKNYSIYIIKKNYSITLIQEIIDNSYDKNKNMTLYNFINYFFKIIDFYIANKGSPGDEDEQYILQAIKIGTEAMNNVYLMNKIGYLYNFNYCKIAYLLGVHKSTISRYYNKNK
jgi:hypothetical protein